MPAFSEHSRELLATCHPDLIRLMNTAILYWDFTIITGHRTQEAQEAAFAAGKSKAHWPNGPHCSTPSCAVDIAPWPIDWSNDARFLLLGGKILGLARVLGIVLRYGGDWDGDGNPRNQSLHDTGHFELPEVKCEN